MRSTAACLALPLVGALLAGAGAQAQPIYKDLERFQDGGGLVSPRGPRGRAEAAPRPARRLTPGPGYVGSDWGLGKPSFWGIGPRPDWGYWSD